MPCFRGIELAIVSAATRRKFPEFPHPDGSSVSLRNASPDHPSHASFLSPIRPGPAAPLSPGSEPPQASKAQPKISVYIPSVPGEKFFFHFTVDEARTWHTYLFFKVFLNGAQVSSSGVNVRARPQGCMFRALFAPSDHFGYQDDGVIVKPVGIEARSYHFMPGPERKSAADDGGLIEVQVFRAEARNKRAFPDDQCRNHEKYGIVLLTDGLVDNPQDCTYYAFKLKDAKDSPYATFHFHYRSWKYLKLLQLVPSDESENVVPDAWGNTAAEKKGKGKVVAEDPSDEFSFEFVPPYGDLIFNDDVPPKKSTDSGQGSGSRQSNSNDGRYSLEEPPELLPFPSYMDTMPQPGKARRDSSAESYLQRPLPELPLPEIPDDGNIKQRSRQSSTTSKVSITPSLLPYVDDEDFTESFELGVATKIEVVSAHDSPKQLVFSASQLLPPPSPEPSRTAEAQEDVTLSDYTSSPPSSEASEGSFPVSPSDYLPTTGSTLERDLAQFSSLERSFPSRRASPKASHLLGGEMEAAFPPTEAQWMSGTHTSGVDMAAQWQPTRAPSPVESRFEGLYLGDYHSAKPDNSARQSLPAAATSAAVCTPSPSRLMGRWSPRPSARRRATTHDDPTTPQRGLNRDSGEEFGYHGRHQYENWI